MKNICKLCLSLLLIFCFNGCNDKLNVKPYTFISDEYFYNTESEMKSAVTAVYAVLRELYNGSAGAWGCLYYACEMRSDNTDYQYSPQLRNAPGIEAVDEFLDVPVNSNMNYIWYTLYHAIHLASVVVERIGDVPFDHPELKVQYEGEVRFLRALMYFHLVRLWGEVPLRKTATTNPDNAFTEEKATVDQLYDFILEDLQFAIDHLPARSEQLDADRGRVTKGAALTMQGEVYLTLKDYPNTIASLEQVTGYELLTGPDGYASIFDPGNKNNAESIFEVQYSASLNLESTFIYAWGPRDARPALTGFPGTCTGRNTPTEDIAEAYEPGDLRKDASIAYWVDPANKVYFESFGKNNDSAIYIKKFYHPGTYQINGRADENFPVYRYAYVKLMLADALNETQDRDPGQALDLLNEVRVRAGLAQLTITDQEELRKAIFREMRVEVAFEHHRWYQLLRLPPEEAVEIMRAHGVKQKERFRAAGARMVPPQVSRLSEAAYNVQTYMLLFPITERETRLNGFGNNPGWE